MQYRNEFVMSKMLQIHIMCVMTLSEMYTSGTCPATNILDVIKYCDHPRQYQKIPSGGRNSNTRWTPPIGGLTTNKKYHMTAYKRGDWGRHVGHTGVTC